MIATYVYFLVHYKYNGAPKYSLKLIVGRYGIVLAVVQRSGFSSFRKCRETALTIS